MPNLSIKKCVAYFFIFFSLIGLVCKNIFFISPLVDLRNRRQHFPHDCRFPNLDLFLPMHHKDAVFASVLFKSIETNNVCFRKCIVVVPPESKHVLSAVVPPWADIYVTPDPMPENFGYLSQQIVKLYADTYTDAEMVLILESDMIFTQWKRKCFFDQNNKPLAFCLNFEEDKAGKIWKRGTEHAIGAPVDGDCVVNTPFLFPTKIFPLLRAHLRKNGRTINDFMKDYFIGHSKGWEATDLLFSEFNIISFFIKNYYPNFVTFVTPRDKKWEYWGNCSKHIGAEIKRNYNLENPKLTMEYFERAYKHIKIPQKLEYKKLF